MQDLFKIVAVTIITAIIALSIKKQLPQFSSVITLLCGIAIITFILSYIQSIMSSIYAFSNSFGLDHDGITILLKVLGISVIGSTAADLCNDMGESALAAKLQLACAIAAFYSVIPLFSKILQVFNDLI